MRPTRSIAFQRHTDGIVARIRLILFVDPISFLLHLPEVAYNSPTHANEHLLSYFGSKDMVVAHTLFRRFVWSDNALWKEDIQDHRVAVVLADRDVIVATTEIGPYLMGVDVRSLETQNWEIGVCKGDGLDV
ncbi:hypothetical protein V2G26_018240 [Clonostachys chloroleuca]